MKNNFPKIPFILSVVFFLFSCSVFVFLLKVINDNNQKSQSKEQAWRAETQKRDEIRALDRSVKIIEDDRIQLETHFAKSSDIVSFLDTIEGLAPKVGVKAEVVVLNDESGLVVEMKASGTFAGLYKFLTLLENSPYALEFIGMGLHKEGASDVAGKGTPVSKWDANFKIRLLSFVP